MPLLDVQGLTGGYGRIRVLDDVSFCAEPGEITVILGANGAGKTTTLRAIMGAATIMGGHVRISNSDVTRWATSRIIRECSAMIVPEGRGLFPDLTVKENLAMGAYAARLSRRRQRQRIDELAEAFPMIHQKLDHKANALSGGEQQIVAIGRAIMAEPRLLLADEVSQGIAPILTLQLWDVLRRLAERGTSVLLVEQNVSAALKIADRGLILKNGRVVHHGYARDLASNLDVASAYLG